MESQQFSPAAYSPDASYYMPADEPDDDTDASWAEHAQIAGSLPTDDVMLAVAEMFSNSPALRAMIEEIKAHPFTPGERRHLHISDAMKLGDELATLIDRAMDDAVGMRQAGRAA